MRYSLLLILFFAFTSAVVAQRVSGKVTDTAGKSIEYVNIGLAGTTTGVISNARGDFSIYIPDSLSRQEMVFSHLSYDPLTVPASELVRRMALGEEIEVRLPERSIRIEEIVVFSGKARYRRVGAGHLGANRNGAWSARPRRPAIAPSEIPVEWGDSLYRDEYNGEIMSALKIKQPMLLREVSFPVLKMTHDSILLRINFYTKNGDDFLPLHQFPVYTMVPHTLEKTYLDVDVSDEQIVVRPGKCYIGLELVRYYGYRPDGVFLMPFHWGEGYRKTGIDRFEEVQAHTGIQAYGRLLPE